MFLLCYSIKRSTEKLFPLWRRIHAWNICRPRVGQFINIILIKGLAFDGWKTGEDVLVENKRKSDGAYPQNMMDAAKFPNLSLIKALSCDLIWSVCSMFYFLLNFTALLTLIAWFKLSNCWQYSSSLDIPPCTQHSFIG